MVLPPAIDVPETIPCKQLLQSLFIVSLHIQTATFRRPVNGKSTDDQRAPDCSAGYLQVFADMPGLTQKMKGSPVMPKVIDTVRYKVQYIADDPPDLVCLFAQSSLGAVDRRLGNIHNGHISKACHQ